MDVLVFTFFKIFTEIRQDVPSKPFNSGPEEHHMLGSPPMHSNGQVDHSKGHTTYQTKNARLNYAPGLQQPSQQPKMLSRSNTVDGQVQPNGEAIDFQIQNLSTQWQPSGKALPP